MSVLKLDVTGKVVDGARGALEGMLKKVGPAALAGESQETDHGDLVQAAEPDFDREGNPVPRDPAADIALGPIKAQDSNLIARLDLLASPRLVSGTKPVNDSIPLPSLGRTTSGTDTAVVLVEGVLAYAAANDLLGNALEGKKFGKWWARITIEDVTALPGGKGKIIWR